MNGYLWAAVALWVSAGPMFAWYETCQRRIRLRRTPAAAHVHPSQRGTTTTDAAAATSQPQPWRPHVIVHQMSDAELERILTEPGWAATLADIDALIETGSHS